MTIPPYVTRHVGSTDVTYLELSQKNGFSADYGHLDLNLGLHVRDEVYPPHRPLATRTQLTIAGAAAAAAG